MKPYIKNIFNVCVPLWNVYTQMCLLYQPGEIINRKLPPYYIIIDGLVALTEWCSSRSSRTQSGFTQDKEMFYTAHTDVQKSVAHPICFAVCVCRSRWKSEEVFNKVSLLSAGIVHLTMNLLYEKKIIYFISRWDECDLKREAGSWDEIVFIFLIVGCVRLLPISMNHVNACERAVNQSR